MENGGSFPVRFPSLHGIAPLSTNYIHIDEAIDELGKIVYPGEWGVSELWRNLPLRRSGTKQLMFKVRLKRNSKDRYTVTERSFGCGESNMPRMWEICIKFDDVRKQLAEALGGFRIAAYKVHLDGVIDHLGKGQSGIWSTQERAVFLTGYGHEFRDGADRKFRVALSRQEFRRWLAVRGAAGVEEGPKNVLFDELVAGVGKSVFDYAKAENVRLTRPLLQEMLGELLGPRLTDYKFRKLIWSVYGGKSGRPPKISVADKNTQREAIEAVMRKAIRDQEK